MIPLVLSIVIAVVGFPDVPVLAGEPTGLAEFPWGAARDQMALGLVRDKCASSLALDGLQDRKIVCYGYQLESVGPVTLKLEFIDGTFQGYDITVPLRRASELKTAVTAQLGTPTFVSAVGESIGWEWPSGTVAVFTRRCIASEEACLLVSTQRAVDPSWRTRGRDGRARKGP